MNNLNEINIKFFLCNYYDDIIKIHFDLDSNLVDEKLYENIWVYNISCQSLIAAKPLIAAANPLIK